MTRLSTEHGDVSLTVDGPDASSTGLVLGHGAGGGMDSVFMRAAAAGLGASGICVFRFNFVYAELGRKAPDRQPVLEATFRDVVEHVRTLGAWDRLVLGGKSMGGRIASHVVADGTEASGLVFLGYPLHPPGRPDRLRAEHLKHVRIPMLFVEGTRDPFCPLDTLERVRADLTAPTAVAIIDDGDHSFKVRAASGRSTQDAWVEAVEAVARWMKTLPG